MAKSFSASTLAALAANEFGVVDLLTFDFPVLGTIEITNAGRDVGPITMPYGSGRTFTGNGTLDAVVTDAQELEFNKAEIKITINGASAAFLTAIQTGDHIDTRIRMYKLFYTDETSMNNGNNVEQYYDGVVVGGNFSISESRSLVNLACSHILYNFRNTNYYITSTDSLRTYVENAKKWSYYTYTTWQSPIIPVQYVAPRWGVKG